MTTRVSNTNIGTDDLNVALGSPFPSNKVNIGKRNIIRRLTGDAARQSDTTQVGSSNLANKLVIGDITILGESTPSVTDHGNADTPVTATVIVDLQTDIFEPSFSASFQILNTHGTSVTLSDLSLAPVQGYPNRAAITLTNSVVGTKMVTVRTTINLLVANPGDGVTSDPHIVGTRTVDATLQAVVLDSGLTVSETGNKTATAFAPTSLTYAYTASSALFPTAYYEYTATLVSGPAAVVTRNNGTISFSLANNTKGTTLSSTYDIEVRMWRDATKSDFMVLRRLGRQTFSAEYKEAFLNITANTSSSVAFANNATVNPRVDLTANFASEAGTTIEWTFNPPLSVASQSIIGSTSTSSTNRVGFNIPINNYSLHSLTHIATASQKYSNGFVIASGSREFKIAGGNWGHAFNAPSSTVAEGFSAQTAVAQLESVVRAPAANHAWTFSLNNGRNAIQTDTNTLTPRISLSATNAGEDFTSNYSVTSTATYDGYSSIISHPLLLRAAYLQQTSTLSVGASNTVTVNSGTATSTLGAAVSTNVTGATIEWSTTNGVSLSTTSGASTTASVSATNAENIKDFTITAVVKDSQGRIVQTLSEARRLTAVSFGATLSGPTSVSNTGIGFRSVTAVFSGTTAVGRIDLTAIKQSGDTMRVDTTTGQLTISTDTDIDPSTPRPPTSAAVYQVRAVPVSPSGIASVTPLTTNLNISCVSQGTGATLSAPDSSVSGYEEGVFAETTASVAGAESGTSLRWRINQTSGPTDVVVYSVVGEARKITLLQSAIGRTTATFSVAVDVVDSSGTVLATLSRNVTLTAERLAINIDITQNGVYDVQAINGAATSFVDVSATSTAVPSAYLDLAIEADSPSTVNAQSGTTYSKTRKATLISTGGSVVASGQIVARVISNSGTVLATKTVAMNTLRSRSYSLTLQLVSANGTTNRYRAESNFPNASFGFTVNSPSGNVAASMQEVTPKNAVGYAEVEYYIGATAPGCYVADASNVSVMLKATGIAHAEPTADFPAISKAVNGATITTLGGTQSGSALNAPAEGWISIRGESNVCGTQAFNGRIQTLVGSTWVDGAGSSGAVITLTASSSNSKTFRVSITTSESATSTHRYVVSLDGVDVKTEQFTLSAINYKATITPTGVTTNYRNIPENSTAWLNYTVATPVGVSYSVTNQSGNGTVNSFMQRIEGTRLASAGAGTTTISGVAVLTLTSGPYAGQVAATLPYNFDVVLYSSRSSAISPASSSTTLDTASVNRTYSESFDGSAFGGKAGYTYSWSLSSADGLELWANGARNSSPSSTSVEVRAPALALYEQRTRTGTLTLTTRDADGIAATASANITVVGNYTRTGTITIGEFSSIENVDTSASESRTVVTVNPSITGVSPSATYSWSVTNTSDWSIAAGQGTQSVTLWNAIVPRYATKVSETQVTVTVTDPMATNSPATKSFTVRRSYAPTGVAALSVTLNTSNASKTGTGKQTASVSFVVTGGVPPYTYNWSAGTPTNAAGVVRYVGGTNSSTSSTLAWDVETVGTHALNGVGGTVTDSQGTTRPLSPATTNLSITVNPSGGGSGGWEPPPSENEMK